MGWWNAGTDGSSLHIHETGLVWGDGPADIIDDAVEKIVKEFEEEWDRKPSRNELIGGLLFSLSVYDDEAPELLKCQQCLDEYPKFQGLANVQGKSLLQQEESPT